MFDPEVPKKEKKIDEHPLQKYTKAVHASKIKYAHNSVNNPQYPKKKEKNEKKNQGHRIKFTIIGNRLAREFIYCVHLAKGMHKYRLKEFDEPEIRAVTGIEWPKVWNDLKITYGGIMFCLQNQVAVLMNGNAVGGEDQFRELIENKYIYHLTMDFYNTSINEFAKYVKGSGRPCVYMHISIDNKHVGTLIFMLYADLVPLTCENFLRLCKIKKGGYSGTPVHRVVKDCWIQCGGFGLKSTELQCENFVVPHDRRGVLCMANDGSHKDCSTQFFVLLQPAPWMADKYVAFGQLIDGEETLKAIEKVPTWYESPVMDIVITQAGILNMECQDMVINKGTIEYMEKHVEDLVALGDWLSGLIMDKLFLDIEFKLVTAIQDKGESGGDHDDAGGQGLHTTQRFLRNKEDIEKQLEKNKTDSEVKPKAEVRVKLNTDVEDNVNNDFDVEEYEYKSYEAEERSEYAHVSLPESLVVKPVKPYYLALTDVPYPGEKDSTYDLKKFLRGDYCLASDLITSPQKQPLIVPKRKEEFSSVMVQVGSPVESDPSLDSDEETELRNYLKLHVDNVSFAGGVIRNIAKGMATINVFDSLKRSESVDESEFNSNLAKLASAAKHREADPEEKKVSLAVPQEDKEIHKIKRRQTGFVRKEDLEKVHVYQKFSTHSASIDDLDSEHEVGRKVRIAPSTTGAESKLRRTPTGFIRGSDSKRDSDPVEEPVRQSVLARLYEDVAHHASDSEHGPTLKDYKPMSEYAPNLLLTYNSNLKMKAEESHEKFVRRSSVVGDSFERILSIQHGKKFARKISSDYVNTIDQVEHKAHSYSLRTIEYAKTRPTMSVSEYQQRNQQYQNEMKKIASTSGTENALVA